MNPPSAGWLRLRYWMGASEAQLVEDVYLLQLPGYGTTPDLSISNVLENAPPPPVGPHLEVLEGGKGKSRKKKADVAKETAPKKRSKYHFLLEAPREKGRHEQEAEYREAHRLDYYLDTDTGRQCVENALRLWTDDGTVRDVVLDALLDQALTLGEVSRVAKAHGSAAQRKGLRAVDIEAFQHLFWDFRGMGRPQIAAFLRQYPMTAYGAVALTLGSTSSRVRMGLETREYSPSAAKALVEQTLYGWLEAQAKHPEAVNVFQLQKAAALVTELQAMQLGASGGGQALQELRQVGVRLRERPPIPSFLSLVQEAGEAQRRDDADYALSRGLIGQDEHEYYMDAIGAGLDIGADLRDRIQAARQAVEEDEEDLLPGRARLT